ncbi:hypothetical protein KY366_08010 [Candidatus Woesearchaeota archaeon]|nr:hypothetical protein [Candidatus Woesearchaeota archaeon]
MKKTFIIGLFLAVMLALSVSAAEVTLSTNSLLLEGKPTKSYSASFIVRNATENLTGLTLSQSGLNDFNLNFSIDGMPGSSFSLNTGQQKTITISGKIPEDINTRLSPFSGSIFVSGAGITTKTITMTVNAKGQLLLDNVKAKVEGDKDSLDNGDSIKDVRPGDKIEFTGDIENTFLDDDDIEIQDVEITITIKNIDDEGDDDLEESDDAGDIDAGDEESFSIEFEIPEDVDEGDYDIDLIVEAEDENGAKHAIEWDLTLKVEKEKHEIQITKATVSPSKIGCSRDINIEVDLKNQGRNDEDEVVVLIESSALDIDNEDITIPEIEEGTGDDTEFEKKYPFTIDEKVKAGNYQIKVNVYYDTDTLSDSKTLDLTVEKCQAEEEETEEEEEDVVVVVSPPEQGEEGEGPEILTSAAIPETTEVSLLQSNTYLFLLIGAIGIAVIVIIVMVVVLLSMKKKV